MSKLFGSSGIRGLVNKFLTPEKACSVGLATASYTQAKKAIIGIDTRFSCLMLKDALVSGLIACGVDVEVLGIVPTPVLAYLTKKLGANIGFMITASHNPPQYNGLKIFDENGISYSDEQQKSIEKIVEDKDYCFANWKKLGKITEIDASHLYFEKVKKIVNLKKKWKLVLDPGCGATFKVGYRLLKKSGCQTFVLNAQPDGNFPARASEPTKESLEDLEHVVKTLNSDIGIAFDGDGDRVAFIDENGKFVDFNTLLAAFAGYTLQRNRGGIVVTNVEASMCFDKIAKKYNGKIIRTKVGDVYLSDAIKKNNAVFGGEPCGAWIHPQFHYCPDGPLSAILLLKALEEKKNTLSEFVSEVPKFITLRENILCNNEVKDKTIKIIEDKIKGFFPNQIESSKVDGIRVSLENGWILIRASGTEPLIRLTVEGESLKVASNILERGVKLIKENIEI